MEYFNNVRYVRLKSHHNKYLVAGDDGESVKQSRNGDCKEGCWAVELIQEHPNMIRLRSCYNKYLTATDEDFLRGWTGMRVLQTAETESNPSVYWEPVGEHFHVKFRALLTGKFLKANAGIPPWMNLVTVDVPENHTLDWFLWGVENLEDVGHAHDAAAELQAMACTGYL